MPLLGPASRPNPLTPSEHGTHAASNLTIADAFRLINEYISRTFTDVVIRSFGMTGVKGFSTSGVPSNNFCITNLNVGNQLLATWTFTGLENDTSYGAWITLSTNTNNLGIFSYSAMVTGVSFAMTATAPANTIANILLLR